MKQEYIGKVLIPGALRSIADDGIVAYTTDLYDPKLQMTQSEINNIEGGIHDDYGWHVLNKIDYDNMPVHSNNVIYFLIGDNEALEGDNVLQGITLSLDANLTNNNLNISGTLSNNTLTL